MNTEGLSFCLFIYLNTLKNVTLPIKKAMLVLFCRERTRRPSKFTSMKNYYYDEYSVRLASIFVPISSFSIFNCLLSFTCSYICFAH